MVFIDNEVSKGQGRGITFRGVMKGASLEEKAETQKSFIRKVIGGGERKERDQT